MVSDSDFWVVPAPSLHPWSLALTPGPQHTPRDSGEAQGESQPPSAQHRAFLYYQVPPHSGQWPSQHLNIAAPLGGEMLWAASPEGRCLPRPNLRPEKDSEKALLGDWRAHSALRPKVRQLQAGPSMWLLQVPLCKMQQAQSHKTKTQT